MAGDSTDDKFAPVTAADVTDDKLFVGEFRAFRRETRDILESILRTLQALSRIESRLDTQQDAINENDKRLNDHERRLAALEKPRRKAARKK